MTLLLDLYLSGDLNPANIRSVNASFDPANRDSTNMLAANGSGNLMSLAQTTGNAERGWQMNERDLEGKKQRYERAFGRPYNPGADLPPGPERLFHNDIKDQEQRLQRYRPRKGAGDGADGITDAILALIAQQAGGQSQ